MVFFDKLSDLARSIGALTDEAIATNKLNSRISEGRTAINELMFQIGEHYYEKHCSGETVDAEVYEMMVEIDEHQEVIKELETQLKAESALVCAACGKENAPGTKFCQECGSKLEQFQSTTCPACGETIPDGARFCGFCGEKL